MDKRVDNKAKKQNQKVVSKIRQYQQVFSGPDGEAVLNDLMKTHYIVGSTFDGDVNKALFREGERNVVLRILSMLKMDVKLIQERIRLHEESVE
jgi:hypothetical protein